MRGPPQRGAVRFGVFDVDTQSGELRKNGVKLKLQDQPFRVLEMLLERPGKVVTREELQKRLWPDETFLDFDNGLNTAVNKLREVLNDSASNSRYVETVPRRGYRFLVPVERWKEPEHTDQGETAGDGTPPEQTRRILRLLWAVLIALSILLILVLLGVIPPWYQVAPPERGSLRKLALAVNEPVSVAVISPNGIHIAYVTTSGVLKVQDLDQTEPRDIAGPGVGTGITNHPSWSPDSTSIAFPFGNELRKIPATGGPATTVCELPGQYLESSWSLDGNSILFGARHALYEVPAQGGQPTILVEPWDPTLPYLGGPQMLPSENGRKLLYGAFSSGANDVQIVVQDLATGRRETLGKGFAFVHGPPGHIIYRRFDPPGILALPFSVETFKATGKPLLIGIGEPPLSISRDGTLVYLERTAGLQQLVWKDRDGNTLGTIGRPRPNFSFPTLSPDDKRVAFTEWVEEGNPDIWIYETDGPGETRFTSHEGRDRSPVWHPDAKHLAFTSSRNGDRNMFVKQADGTGEATELLNTAGLREYPRDWSQDERILLFVRTGPENIRGGDIWYLRRTNDGRGYEEVAFVRTPAAESTPQLSPNGRFVAYVSDETGQQEVYVRSFPDGRGQQQVSARGGVQPRWRADGKELFYVEGKTLMSVPISTSSSLTRGAPTQLFSSEALDRDRHVADAYPYDVSNDGRRFVLAEQVEASSNTIRVVENWFAEFADKRND